MKSKELIILSTIVLFDLATKLIANYFLPYEETVNIFGNRLSFYLTYNEGATGGQTNFLMEGVKNKNVTFLLSCINGLILLGYFLVIRKKQMRIIYKVLVGVTIFLVLSFLMAEIEPHLLNVAIPAWITSVIGKLAGLTLYGTFFYLAKDRWLRFFILSIIACGVGNLLSSFYLPYKVIDFISIEGSYESFKIGVFNFADLAFDIGVIGLLVSLSFLFFKKFRIGKHRPI
jgi:lipoprotein signal peptidase